VLSPFVYCTGIVSKQLLDKLKLYFYYPKGLDYMSEVIEIPAELTYFQLPNAVQERLQFLLDRQDSGEQLSQTERQEAEGLVELTEFLSLIRLRSQRVTKQ
jgi:hypothetical protein